MYYAIGKEHGPAAPFLRTAIWLSSFIAKGTLFVLAGNQAASKLI